MCKLTWTHSSYFKPKQYNTVYGFKYKICDGERQYNNVYGFKYKICDGERC